MHAGIFWGFVLLTIGTANIVTGGLIQAVLSIPLDGAPVGARQRHAERRRGHRPRLRSAGRSARRLVDQAARASRYNRDALVILAMIGGVVATELLAQVVRGRGATATSPGRSWRTRWRCRSALARPGRAGGRASSSCGGATSSLVAAFLCYLPFSKHLHIATSFPNILFRKLAPRGELPAMDLEDEDATFGLRTLAGPRLEGPARRLHLHRVRPLPGRLPGLEHGQAAQSQDLHHGHPGHVGRGRARAPPHPELADRARHLRARRHASRRRGALARPIVDTAIPYDAVWDCVTCGACVEACPVLIEHVDKIVGLRRNLVLEDSRFPRELTAAFRAMESQGNPWGQPPSARTRLDEGACRSMSRPSRDGRRRRPARRARGPLLGRLRGRVRRAQPEGRPGGRDVPACGRRPVRGARPGGVVHRRPGPADGQRLRLPDARDGQRRDARPLRDGRADDRHRLPALLQLDRQRVRPAGRGYRIVHHSVVPCRPRLVGPARDRSRGRRGRRPATTGRAASPSTTRAISPATTASSRRRATCLAPRASRDRRWSGRPQDHVLLRRRRRADVDGGDPRHADQRRADAARSSRPARRPWRPPARSAWSCSATGSRRPMVGRRVAARTSARCSPPAIVGGPEDRRCRSSRRGRRTRSAGQRRPAGDASRVDDGCPYRSSGSASRPRSMTANGLPGRSASTSRRWLAKDEEQCRRSRSPQRRREQGR